MGTILHNIIDWSEVWALLIPLAVILWKKDKTTYLKPVRLFVWITLPLNIVIDLISEFKGPWGVTEDDFFWNNNVFYNIESILRMLLFTLFFILLRQHFMRRIKMAIPFGFIIFVFINFIFFEKFVPQGNYENFSSRLLSTEAALLLFYCIQYFIFLMIEDKTVGVSRQPGFWVVTGLSIYVAVSFFIFLFYDYLSKVTRDFAVGIWDIHNIVFIVLCLGIAKQLNSKNE